MYAYINQLTSSKQHPAFTVDVGVNLQYGQRGGQDGLVCQHTEVAIQTQGRTHREQCFPSPTNTFKRDSCHLASTMSQAPPPHLSLIYCELALPQHVLQLDLQQGVLHQQGLEVIKCGLGGTISAWG